MENYSTKTKESPRRGWIIVTSNSDFSVIGCVTFIFKVKRLVVHVYYLKQFLSNVGSWHDANKYYGVLMFWRESESYL